MDKQLPPAEDSRVAREANKAALAASLEENADLLAVAQPLLEDLRPHLLRSDSLLILADRHGMILSCTGDSDLLEREQALPLQPGSWLCRQPKKPLPTRSPGSRRLEALGMDDPRMATAIRRASRIAGMDIPLLIEGETGSGKEWFAQAFHEASERRQGPFVAVNCAAIPATLIEAELFGYIDGAFTGARRLGAPGKIREADGGTLFLDEIGDMPLALQAVLLRVLETRRVVPLGGTAETAVDITLVCASHHPLQQLVSQGLFRADLFFRLSGMTVSLPPLRERSDFDQVVCQMLNEEAGGQSINVPSETFALLRCYGWPGNLRQLRNVLRLCVALLGDEPVLTPDYLPGEILEASHPGAEQRGLRAVQDVAIQNALSRHAGNISAAARELGITRTTLYRKLRSTA